MRPEFRMARDLNAAGGARRQWGHGRALVAGLALLGLASTARAAERLELFPESVPPAEYFREDAAVTRELNAGIAVPEAPPEPIEPDAEPAPAKVPFWEMHNPAVVSEAFRPLPPPGTPPRDFWSTDTVLTTTGALVIGTFYAASGLWEFEHLDFHFQGDGWFGRDTYAGGADKVSHFSISATVSRELALLYDSFGVTRTQSAAWAFGITAFTGFMVEIGDGLSPYGFSWQDLTVDVLGSGMGVFLTRHGLNDVFGVRVGKVPTDEPVSHEERYLGSHYGTEIYSGDFKLAGLARRWKIEPSVARFLLFSVTYQTKGYDYVPTLPDKQRLVGFELGINFPEVLAAVGVPETTWWGLALYKVFNFFRIPFTSFGWRYDLNAHKWHGPDTGTKYYH
jgi:hypothetical protein